MSFLNTAIHQATIAHEGQFDRGGHAYILHPLRIMYRLRTGDEELMSIAVLHDSPEDSNGKVTIDSLSALGAPYRVLKALELLTHDPSVDYMDYIRALQHNPDAVRVKLEDLRDNSDVTRLKGLRQKDFDRLARYSIAHSHLIQHGAK